MAQPPRSGAKRPWRGAANRSRQWGDRSEAGVTAWGPAWCGPSRS